MKITRRFLFLIIVSCFLAFAYADQYDFETPDQTQTVQTQPITAQITINRQFVNIGAVVSKLNSLGVNASINKSNQSEISNQQISVNTTVTDFINQAASKFNYAAKISGNSVIFTALNPAQSKPIVVRNITETVQKNNPNNSVDVIIWKYDPSDKYISYTLNKWAKQAGYQLIWQTQDDFEVQSTGSLTGGFKTAVNEVLKSFKYSEHPLKAQWYQNKVVVITNIGN